MAFDASSGISSFSSPYSVDETTERIQNLLAEKGLKVFCIVDHSGEAQRIGLQMRPTKLVLFGSPMAGTPVMVAAPSIAIDLPLKALVAEDETGAVWVSFNSLEYLQRRHDVADDVIAKLASPGTLLETAVR
ncbi:MAG: DUF302 domain-containing protein [Chloroflexota bacterium]|nr:DUF302 domain-containing protein [Chloroflexota bacterium]